ncbi:MAG TPA: phosphomannomutase/phosphoglucomutase [Acidobacteriota bacterium]|nr:phosphomannomutase/phosphoglucomutase [Acidobacteriota bacterium]
MRWDIRTDVDNNSFDYFEKTLITDNGFREYDVRWIVGDEINPNGFFVMGRAYATLLQRDVGSKKSIVGHDFRSYSQELLRSFTLGMVASGAEVIDVGLALTPMVYYAQHHFNAPGGAQVTASHNENGWCGLKLANGLSSTLGPDGIKRLKEIVHSGDFSEDTGSYEIFDGLDEAYLNDIVGGKKLSNPPKVVVACGNGTPGRFVPDVLEALGCEVVRLDCDADWTFPRFNPNPEDVKFLHEISRVTLKEGAAIGIGIDGDGDRIGVVNEKGEEIYSDKLGLLLARWMSEKHPNRIVVTDVKSTGLFSSDPVLAANGYESILWKTGHSYIKAKVRETGAIAGFEKSGHWFLADPLGRGYDDAARSAALLLRMLDESGKSLSEMQTGLPKSWNSPTIGAYCPDDEKYDVVAEVTEQYRKDKEQGTVIAGKKIKDLITVNGVRFVLEDDSWGLVRASSNKPSLVLVAESVTSQDQLYAIMKHIQDRLEKGGRIGEYDQEMPEPK